MLLPLETLTSIIRTDLPILVELIDLVISNGVTQMVNFPTRIPGSGSHSPALWIYLFLLTLVFVLQWLSFHWEILLLPLLPLAFQ